TAEEIATELLPMLSQAAEQQGIDQYTPVAMDWLNGRRTPYANQRLKGAICDLNLGSSSPAIFSALVESTAHGAKAIV
ncbi:FGGY-family carbohydrate kinase, partial [Escherichia coli]|nr:FGGY-family carbohydrate kinase [Escherichia coli]